MPDPVLGWIQAIVGWLKTPYKILLALFLLSITALVLPDRISDRMMVGDWVRSHRVLEEAVALGSGFYLLVWGIELSAQRIRVRRQLGIMSRDELIVIQSFMHDGGLRTRSFVGSTATCEAMVKMKILERCDPNFTRGRGANALYYTMCPWVFQHLKRHPELYSGR